MFDKLFAVRQTSPSSPGSGMMFGGGRSAAGIRVTEQTALTLGAVYSAVKTISETIAMVPWRHMETRGESKKLLAGSTLDELLNKQANEEVAAFQFREFLMQCALLDGNGYAEIERSIAGEPIALWPLHPDYVTPKRDDAGKLFYRIREDGGQTKDLKPESMFHLRGPTTNGVVGRSVISVAAEAWGLGIAEQQFAAGYFGNGSTPGGVIQAGEGSPKMEPEAVNNMLASHESRHRGSKNAGRVSFLEYGMTFKTVNVSQKDAQFIESRKFSVTDVARWFRLPPHKIGDLERATFSNIESQETTFVTSAIQPWVTRFEQEAAIKLVSQPMQYTRIVLLGLLRGDSVARAEYYTKMRDLGTLSPNDILKLEDMDPYEGGDIRLVPLNMVSVDQAGAAPETGNTSAAMAVAPVLMAAFERVAKREANAMARAIKSGKDFKAWANEFYATYRDHLRDAIAQPLAAMEALAGPGCRWSTTYATDAEERGKCTQTCLPWEPYAIELIEQITGEKYVP